MSQVLGVVIEHDQEGFKPVSLEVISAARKLADQVSGKVVVFYLCLEADEQVDLFIQYGADEVRLLQHPDLKTYIHENYGFALTRELEKSSVDYLFLPATNNGKELSAVLSAQLGVGVATDCISLSVWGEGDVEAVRPVSAGKALSTVRSKAKSPISLLYARMFSARRILQFQGRERFLKKISSYRNFHVRPSSW